MLAKILVIFPMVQIQHNERGLCVRLLIGVFLIMCISAFSFIFQFDGYAGYDFGDLYDSTRYRVIVPFMGASFTASGGFKRDNIVFPPYSDVLMNNYWYWDEAFFSWLSDNFSIEVGVKEHEIGCGNFYHLFLDDNSVSYPSVHSSAKIGRFNVETLWGGLRFFEKAQAPEKGINYRSLSLNVIEGLEIGYEDAVLYLNRVFDPFYFIVPIPVAGIQEFWHLNAPWGYTSGELNDNSMVGAWVKYSGKDFSTYFETLVDDINMNRFFSPDRPESFNPDKIAFLAGFTGNRKNLRFTVEVAGATAFTFERTSQSTPYDYVMFENVDLPIESNMLGYVHGENSLSMVIDFCARRENWSVAVSWEGLIHGDRTPSLPWHGGDMPHETLWLTGNVSSLMTLNTRISYSWSSVLEWLDEISCGVGFKFSSDGRFLLNGSVFLSLDIEDWEVGL